MKEILSEYDLDMVEIIVKLVKNKYLSKLEQEGGRQKVVAALQRKGFSYYDIESALNRLDDYEF